MICTKKTVPSRGGYRLSYCCFIEESGNNIRQFTATSQNSESHNGRPEQNQGVATIGNVVRTLPRAPFFIASIRACPRFGLVVDAVQIIEVQIFRILDAGISEVFDRNIDEQVRGTAS